ncbi:hypothetical protein H6G89_22660 [Oscillatoria sp. FACHB-1407]|uniref:hypothetical protein n=1 Tax=Oscillatoria sp. FACHB-1407 TaxID=2692847 RepID=UPI00168827D0|nr:hypothetical protein [Oscillatoria sp. FACHB-1407]MBD2463807.1 hypothetical protein [Oscillatoria sp. FACHB-1407]
MNEVVIRAIILLLVFILAGYLISRATKGLIRLVVIAVLTGLFLIAARSMFNQIMESRAANTVPQTPPPDVNITVSPTASPTAIASPTTSPTAAASPATTTDSDTPLQARIGLRNVPTFAAYYVASSNGQPAAAAPASTPQEDYQPDYQPPANRTTTQRPSQQPITGGW